MEARVIRLLVGDEERRVEPPRGVEVEETAPGTFSLRRGEARETFHCVRDGDEVHLAWRGRSYRVTLLREGRRAAHRHAAGSLEAPMPGKVTAVKVREGQAVQKGEEILVVEAMKMENAIRAPKAGRVKRIGVAVGDMVAPGAVLAEIE
jgi:acetyl/propionyl-CoA carboxylase alpha subunit